MASAKDGIGIEQILNSVVDRIPPPSGSPTSPLRALIFDSKYDAYKGVIAYVRIREGTVPARGRLKVMSNGVESETIEIGCFRPGPVKVESLTAGEVGYIATGLKTVGDAPVGDTITLAEGGAVEPLDKYVPMKPMVFAGLYPSDGEDFLELRDALEKLHLNDAALTYQPESSVALGSGFRCGFLGLLHMDVVQERLEREYGIGLLATSPSVAYSVLSTDGSVIEVDNPSHLPSADRIEEVNEPWVDLTLLTPATYIGPLMELVKEHRGEFKKMDYIQIDARVNESGSNGADTSSQGRMTLEFAMPLSEMLIDFYDQVKSRTQGYASMDYSVSGYRPEDLVRLDILVNGESVDALSTIVHRKAAQSRGKDLVTRLKGLIPRQMFEVPIQAAIGSKVFARETIKAMRKNVTAKCYGGDVTRKRKLLQKQAEGKKRMKRVGSVEIPQEAFLAILKVER
jgi:GTP-binding protein LepA